MPNETLVRQILDEIDRNPSISQRQLSDNLGVSIGIVNWHMKRCVTKGLVKLQTAPVRRSAGAWYLALERPPPPLASRLPNLGRA